MKSKLTEAAMTPKPTRKKLDQVIFEAQMEVLKRCVEQKWAPEEIRMALQSQELVTRMAWENGKRPEKGDRLW